MTFDCSTLSGFEQAECEHFADISAFYIYITDLLHFSIVLFLFLFIIYFIIYKWVFRLK